MERKIFKIRNRLYIKSTIKFPYQKIFFSHTTLKTTARLRRLGKDFKSILEAVKEVLGLRKIYKIKQDTTKTLWLQLILNKNATDKWRRSKTINQIKTAESARITRGNWNWQVDQQNKIRVLGKIHKKSTRWFFKITETDLEVYKSTKKWNERAGKYCRN